MMSRPSISCSFNRLSPAPFLSPRERNSIPSSMRSMQTVHHDLYDGAGRIARAATAAAFAVALLLRAPMVFADPLGWNLVWNDEFEGAAVDPAKWTKEVTNA